MKSRARSGPQVRRATRHRIAGRVSIIGDAADPGRPAKCAVCAHELTVLSLCVPSVTSQANLKSMPISSPDRTCVLTRQNLDPRRWVRVFVHGAGDPHRGTPCAPTRGGRTQLAPIDYSGAHPSILGPLGRDAVRSQGTQRRSSRRWGHRPGQISTAGPAVPVSCPGTIARPLVRRVTVSRDHA
jgi:hypothetical protein